MANDDFSADTLNELSQFLTHNGADPKQVANELGLPDPSASPGAVAQNRLDRLKNDPQWVDKFNNGDIDVVAEFHKLTGLVVFQTHKDQQAELARALEAVAAYKAAQ